MCDQQLFCPGLSVLASGPDILSHSLSQTYFLFLFIANFCQTGVTQNHKPVQVLPHKNYKLHIQVQNTKPNRQLQKQNMQT